MSLPIITDFHLALTLTSLDVFIVASIMPLPSVMMPDPEACLLASIAPSFRSLGIGAIQHVITIAGKPFLMTAAWPVIWLQGM